MAHLARHMLVRVDPAVWTTLLHGQAAHWLVAGWSRAGWPLIVRARCSGHDDQIDVGLPLPPFAGKLRLAFRVPYTAIVFADAPPLLADAARCAPPAWRDTIARLLELDGDVRVFGSLAWEHVTGLRYLGETSDLDLVFPRERGGGLLDRAAALAAIAAAAPMTIDAEILRLDGAAVQWRELASCDDQLLVKTLYGPRLETRESFLDADR